VSTSAGGEQSAATGTAQGHAQDAGARPRTVLAVGSPSFFLTTLDISIVNVALARIADELGGGTVAQQWVIDGYTLLFASLLLFAGTLSDRVGAERSLVLGTVLFALASAACGAAPTSAALIAARCAQGAAAAVMLPASMALIREAYPDPRRRSAALGVWAVGGAVAGLVGQPLGGLLTTVDWRWIFAINLPVCAAMVVLLRRAAASPRRPACFDAAGQVLAVVALTGLVYGLIEGGHRGVSDPVVGGALVVAVLGLVAFVVVQARRRHPMVPLSLLRARGLQVALPIGFAFMVGKFGNVFVVSLYLQQQLGMSPLAAGLVFVPSAVFAIAGNLTSGLVANRFGQRLPVVAGQLAMVVGLVGLVAAAQAGSPWLVALALVPIGAGGSMAMPVVTAVVLEGVPAERAGTASAVFNTFRQVGGAVAIAVFGGLLAAPGSFDAGLRTSLLVAAAC